MDSVSQIALGAAVSVAVFRKQQPVWRSALLGAVVGTLPDLDVLIRHGDPISNMTLHRTHSHALFYLTLISPLLAWLWLKICRYTVSFKLSLLAIWLVLITHPLLDTLTIYGTQLLLPFTNYPYGTGSVFVIDPLFTLPVLIGTAITLLKRRLFWNTAGLAFGCVYLLAGLMAQQHVYQLARQQLDVPDSQLLVSATPFNILLWRVVVTQPEQYQEGFYSLLDNSQTIKLQRYARNGSLLNNWQHEPLVARLTWFTDGFVKLEQQQQQLVLTDLRMGLEPGYSFSFAFQIGEDGSLSTPQQLAMPNAETTTFVWLWQRMMGQTSLSLAQWLALPDKTAQVSLPSR